MKKKYLLESFGLAAGTIVYVGLVGLIMTNAQRIFGSMPNPINFMTFLLLFVVSATITGALVLGRPLYLYFSDRKKDAFALFGCTLSWLLLVLIIILITQLV